MQMARLVTALAPLAAGAAHSYARPVAPGPGPSDTPEPAARPNDRLSRLSPGAPQHPFQLPVPAPQIQKTPAIDRDFDAYPTLINIPRMEGDLWLVGDVHGDYFRYTTLLKNNGLIGRVGAQSVNNPYPPVSPVCDTTPEFHWRGGNATLVQTGDVIDKGYWNTRLLHLHMNLEVQAPEAGGRFFMTYGNHEVTFLRDPINGKTTGPGGLAIELWGCQIKPATFASDDHVMGHWLRRLPVAVRIGTVLAGHGGQTSSRSLDGLRVYWQQGLLRDGFATVTLNGLNSFLRARDFAGQDGKQGSDLVAALDPDRRHPVRHIVHGHNPEVGVPGKITTYGMQHKVPTLIDIDVGLTELEDYSKGWLLHLFERGDTLVGEACNHKGLCHTLWKEPAAR